MLRLEQNFATKISGQTYAPLQRGHLYMRSDSLMRFRDTVEKHEAPRLTEMHWRAGTMTMPRPAQVSTCIRMSPVCVHLTRLALYAAWRDAL